MFTVKYRDLGQTTKKFLTIIEWEHKQLCHLYLNDPGTYIIPYYDWIPYIKSIGSQSSIVFLSYFAFNISSHVRFADPSSQHFAVLSADKDQQVHDVPHARDDELPAHHSSPEQLDVHVHHGVWNDGGIPGRRDPLDGRGEFALLILQHVPGWCWWLSPGTGSHQKCGKHQSYVIDWWHQCFTMGH